MAATSWGIIITGQGDGNFVTTVKKTGTISGGTNRALPTQDQGAFEQLVAALERGRRWLSNQIANGNVGVSATGIIRVAIDTSGAFPMYTTTVNTGGTMSGTNVALPLHEVDDKKPWPEAIERGFRWILTKVANGD